MSSMGEHRQPALDESSDGFPLEVYLRGGQVLTLTVTDWSLKKSLVDGAVTELSWTMANGDQMPFIKLSDISAVVRRG